MKNKPNKEVQNEERMEAIKMLQDWTGDGKENGKTPGWIIQGHVKPGLLVIKEETSTQLLTSKDDLEVGWHMMKIIEMEKQNQQLLNKCPKGTPELKYLWYKCQKW